MITARPICLVLLRQAAPNARSFALLNAGSSIAARMAMIAMTTSNSISVNPHSTFDFMIVLLAMVFIVIFFRDEFWRERLPLPPIQGPHKRFCAARSRQTQPEEQGRICRIDWDVS